MFLFVKFEFKLKTVGGINPNSLKINFSDNSLLLSLKYMLIMHCQNV